MRRLEHAAGFAVGALAAFVSNFFLGQGTWTPWQMLGWGACGVAGSLAPRLLRRSFALAAFCFVLGLAFSAFMDVWNWLAFYDEHTWQTFVAVHARGLPFDLAHAIGNVVIALAAGPELRRLLDRYGKPPAYRGRMGVAALLTAALLAVTPASYVGFASAGRRRLRGAWFALDAGAHRMGDARSSRGRAVDRNGLRLSRRERAASCSRPRTSSSP